MGKNLQKQGSKPINLLPSSQTQNHIALGIGRVKPEAEKSHDLTSSVSLAVMELSSSLRSSILKSLTMSNHLPLPPSPAPGNSPQMATNTEISQSSPKKRTPSKQRISSPERALVPVEAQMTKWLWEGGLWFMVLSM